jgi:cysteine desulfurase/selenocysteine lyase
MAAYYEHDNANVHRGVHSLSARATFAYERARGKLHKFLNAPDMHQIIFTRGTTEAVNLVAQSWGRANLKTGDEVLITEMEHHSNIVPWQLVCEQTGARLVVAPVAAPASSHGRLVQALGWTSSLGGPSERSDHQAVKEIRVSLTHGAVVLVDGAQATPHLQIDVQDIDCDFYALSGHKVYGPTGIGVLYGKKHLLEAMPPWQGGGEMILSVSFEKTTYNELPRRSGSARRSTISAASISRRSSSTSTICSRTPKRLWPRCPTSASSARRRRRPASTLSSSKALFCNAI